MVVYIKDRVTNEVIAVTYDVFVVYGNELIFNKQKAAKTIANSLSDSILFLVHREAKHFISYSAEIDQSIVTLNKNLIAVAMDSENIECERNYLEYKNQLKKWKHDIECSSDLFLRRNNIPVTEFVDEKELIVDPRELQEVSIKESNITTKELLERLNDDEY